MEEVIAIQREHSVTLFEIDQSYGTGILKRVNNIKINGKDTWSGEKEVGADSNPFEANLA